MNTRIAIGIIVIAAIVLVGYFFWPNTEKKVEDIPSEDQTVEQTEVIYNLSHEFDEGTHTISGTVSLPTPCHELRENIRIAESFPEQVSIDLSIVDTGGICIQVIAEHDFSIDVEVDENASFALTIDGTSVSVPNLVVE